MKGSLHDALLGGVRRLLLVLLVAAPLASAQARERGLPAPAMQALQAPGAVTVYAIHPDPRALGWPFGWRLHGYRILGKVPVTRAAEATELRAVPRQAVLGPPGLDNKCVFYPRHAVRLATTGGTYDFLICVGCSQLEVYDGDRSIAMMSAMISPVLLHRILSRAHIRLAE